MTFPLPEFMAEALALARRAAAEGAVPVGAIITLDGKMIASASNAPPGHHDPSAHAEMLAIRQAAKLLGRDRLDRCDLWVTLEPCAMCAGAISHARISRLYFGAEDEKGGGVVHGARVFSHPTCHHRPEIYGGIGATEASVLLRDFFMNRR